jgi:hypothetical protein
MSVEDTKRENLAIKLRNIINKLRHFVGVFLKNHGKAMSEKDVVGEMARRPPVSCA